MTKGLLLLTGGLAQTGGVAPQKIEKLWLDKTLKTWDIQQFFPPYDADQMDAYPISKDFLKKRPDDPVII